MGPGGIFIVGMGVNVGGCVGPGVAVLQDNGGVGMGNNCVSVLLVSSLSVTSLPESAIALAWTG